ncbi:MAG: hypothetical protein R3F59_36860 [Myxococcota bacterium]
MGLWRSVAVADRAALQAVAAHPGARRVAHLALPAPDVDGSVLAQLPALRALSVGGNLDLAALGPFAARCEVLEVSGTLRIDAAAPALRGIDAHRLRWEPAGATPALRTLAVKFLAEPCAPSGHEAAEMLSQLRTLRIERGVEVLQQLLEGAFCAVRRFEGPLPPEPLRARLAEVVVDLAAYEPVDALPAGVSVRTAPTGRTVLRLVPPASPQASTRTTAAPTRIATRSSRRSWAPRSSPGRPRRCACRRAPTRTCPMRRSDRTPPRS